MARKLASLFRFIDVFSIRFYLKNDALYLAQFLLRHII